MKKLRVSQLLIHTFMLASIVAVVLMFAVLGSAENVFLAIGSSSWLIALGVSSSSACSTGIGIILFAWFFIFPTVLLLSYVLVWIKQYHLPFCIITTMDTIIVIIWTIICIKNQDMYAFKGMLPDAIVSVSFTVALIASEIIERRRSTGG